MNDTTRYIHDTCQLILAAVQYAKADDLQYLRRFFIEAAKMTIELEVKNTINERLPII